MGSFSLIPTRVKSNSRTWSFFDQVFPYPAEIRLLSAKSQAGPSLCSPAQAKTYFCLTSNSIAPSSQGSGNPAIILSAQKQEARSPMLRSRRPKPLCSKAKSSKPTCLGGKRHPKPLTPKQEAEAPVLQSRRHECPRAPEPVPNPRLPGLPLLASRRPNLTTCFFPASSPANRTNLPVGG